MVFSTFCPYRERIFGKFSSIFRCRLAWGWKRCKHFDQSPTIRNQIRCTSIHTPTVENILCSIAGTTIEWWILLAPANDLRRSAARLKRDASKSQQTIHLVTYTTIVLNFFGNVARSLTHSESCESNELMSMRIQCVFDCYLNCVQRICRNRLRIRQCYWCQLYRNSVLKISPICVHTSILNVPFARRCWLRRSKYLIPHWLRLVGPLFCRNDSSWFAVFYENIRRILILAVCTCFSNGFDLDSFLHAIKYQRVFRRVIAIS